MTLTQERTSRAITRANYDRLSPWYDRIAASERPLRAAGLHLLAAELGERVLEIGCGTGQSLLALARAVGPHGSAVGLDLSPGMLAQAAQNLAAAHLADRAVLLEGDAARLPFPPQQFDAAFISFTLELFPLAEIPVVLGEIKRVLRPQARLAVVALAQTEGNVVVRLYEQVHALLPHLVDCRPIDTSALLQDAGFTVTADRRQSLWGLPADILLAQT